jgi:hypothetical protein
MRKLSSRLAFRRIKSGCGGREYSTDLKSVARNEIEGSNPSIRKCTYDNRIACCNQTAPHPQPWQLCGIWEAYKICPKKIECREGSSPSPSTEFKWL